MHCPWLDITTEGKRKRKESLLCSEFQMSGDFREIIDQSVGECLRCKKRSCYHAEKWGEKLHKKRGQSEKVRQMVRGSFHVCLSLSLAGEKL